MIISDFLVASRPWTNMNHWIDAGLEFIGPMTFKHRYTCASVSPNRAANFRRSGFVMYFWIWNWISSPFRCNWLKTARDQDRFRFTWPVGETVDPTDDAAFELSALANDALCVTYVSKYRPPEHTVGEFPTDGICCDCFGYWSGLKLDAFEFIYLK